MIMFIIFAREIRYMREMEAVHLKLLKHLAKDDDEAYSLLYRRFYIPLVLFAEKYVADEEVAKDLVQEVFISMLGQKKEFVSLAALKAYLYNSVKNRCINYIRNEKVKKRFESYALQECDNIDLFWERVLEEDVYGRLMTAVDSLPRQYQRVMLLSLEGCKISEVADKMEISLDTAKEYKKEAKKRLVAKIQELDYLVLLPVIFYL